MKTAISLPDDVFERAEHLARRLKKSRSELYRVALQEYVARHDPDEVTETMDRVVSRVEPRSDGFAAAAAYQALTRSEW